MGLVVIRMPLRDDSSRVQARAAVAPPQDANAAGVLESVNQARRCIILALYSAEDCQTEEQIVAATPDELHRWFKTAMWSLMTDRHVCAHLADDGQHFYLTQTGGSLAEAN